MAIYPCSLCGMRRPGKLASAYWAWFNADGARSAWKLRYCLECAPEGLAIVLQSQSHLDSDSTVFDCLSCGTNATDDSDPVYLTLYLPGKEPTEYAVQLCGACAAKLRIPITENGERLPDRGGVVRGPSPSITAWDALGIEPRPR